MYEDAWYSFVPEPQRSGRSSQGPGHRRRESLLQQPNGSQAPETLDALLEEDDDTNEDEDLLEAREDGLRQLRRTRSFPSAAKTAVRPKFASTFAQLKPPPSKTAKKRGPKRKKEVTLDALHICDGSNNDNDNTLEWQKLLEVPVLLDTFDDGLLQASQQDFLTYRDQLEMTERHLASLVTDTNGALRLLSSLADSFRTVEDQTSSFQAQCDDLVSEQRRLQRLADDVGTDLHYYGYLDTATRRLNAPGASRLADGDELADIFRNLDACIAFMAASEHSDYRDADQYLARYQALLTKALHLLEVGFTARLDTVATDLARQIGNTKSDAAQHALAYGRFEELLVEKSYALVPNVQQVVSSAYTPQGAARAAEQSETDKDKNSYAIYTNTANNIFTTYLQWRDQVLRPVMQKELDAFHADVKAAASIETAARSYIKQSFERSYHEVLLFAKVFAVDPQYSADAAHSVFGTLRAYRSDLVNAVNVAPLATLLQMALASVNDLTVVCNVLGWITHEYLLLEHDDDDYGDSDDDSDSDNGHREHSGDSYMTAHSRQLAARLLAEHLWVFADALFEAEVAKTISKVPVVVEALKIEPSPQSTTDIASASTTAYPPVRRAIELLAMFDQAMPKERCQRSSPVVFKIVKETILALQRAEARIKSGRLATDADLFMIKNLLVLKNELLALDIGDIRDGAAKNSGAQFGQIWEALSMAQHLVGYFSTFIPGSTPAAVSTAPASPAPQSLWSRAASVAGGYTRAASVVGSMTGSLMPGAGNQASNAINADISEQLDDALRRSITAFTTRWGKTLHDGASRKLGGRNVAKMERELDELLQAAFGGQPDVVSKLKEAIDNQVRAAEQQEKRGR